MSRKKLAATMVSALLWASPMAFAAEPVGGEEALELFVDKAQLVESATTRSLKQLSGVPENVTVITSEEIRAMNAHTVAEVLDRVTGVMVDSFGDDYMSLSQLHLQGSEPPHVLVLLDEMPINFLAGGNSETTTIPVEIIDRIEIVKGPASSTWGSALGGVINIVTKKPAKDQGGTLYASAGEHGSGDLRAAVSGTSGALGYYLYAGYLTSDGLALDRSVTDPSFFAKIVASTPSGVNLTGTAGFSRPRNSQGDLVAAGIESHTSDRLLFANLSADWAVGETLAAHATLYAQRRVFFQDNDEDGQYGPKGSNFKDLEFDESQQGANVRLLWRTANHEVVGGIDYNRGQMDQTNTYGDYLQSLGLPPRSVTKPDLFRWGAYLNDSIALGAFTVVPGLRFDSHSKAGDFWSPSLGVACRAGKTTTLRLSAARGFTSPALSDLSGGGAFYDPNPDLKPETVRSYQFGVETTALRYLWLKANVFTHNLADAHTMTTSPANPTNTTSVNAGRIKRTGYELEFETAPFHGATLYGGTASVRVNPSGAEPDQDLYSIDLGVKYQSPFINCDLHGHREEWDLPDDGFRGRYKDTIWTLILSREFRVGESGVVTVLGAAHNMFNGDQYSTITAPNPGPWAELGVRYDF